MLLYYIRHGDPIYNPDGLTEKGEQQAFALSDRLVESGIEKVFSSSSNRAIKTAEPLCRRLGLDSTQLDWMHENHVAEEFKGISTHTWCFFDEKVMDIFHSDETFALGERWYEQAAFADTKYKQGTIRVREQTDAFLQALGYKHERDKRRYTLLEEKYKKVAVFAHGGFAMSFLSALLDIPYPTFCSCFHHMGCTGVTVIDFSPFGKTNVVYPRLITYSNDGHLYKEEIKPHHWLGNL